MILGPNQDWIILTIGAIAGALVALSNLGKLIKEGTVNVFNYIKNRRMKNEKVEVMVNSFECIQQKLDSLVAELRPNGGKSLRDLVEKINENTTYNREYVRASLDNDFQMIYETDSIGEYVWVNNTYGRYTGKQEHDLMGYGWINTVCSEDRQRVRTEWESCIEEHRDFNLDYSVIAMDGNKINVTSQARPIKITGAIKGYYGTIKITS
jgi:PAS domain S-box-containing protein